MDKEQNKISCPLFNRQEPAIQRMTDEINKAPGVREKARSAEQLVKEVKALLDCPQYDGAKLDCANCRTICQLRNRTASLVLKAGKLV